MTHPTPTHPTAPSNTANPLRVGAVAIGRNEGERLVRCLTSLTSAPGEGLSRVVYVDSGSSDDSVAFARSIGVDVVELDLTTPFTAARARNAGYERLRDLGDVDAVLFVDGDCELLTGWVSEARELLAADPTVVAVGGKLEERLREASVYNRLQSMEWDRPAGEVRSFSGNALVRARTFDAVGGFNASLIAGEEPELCRRMRAGGHRVVNLATPIALHDSAMYRLREWWTRTERAGYTYAEAFVLFVGAGQDVYRRRLKSILSFALAVPLVVLILAVMATVTGSWWPLVAGLLLTGVYPLLCWKVARGRQATGDIRGDAWLYGAFTTLGKFPQALGVGRYLSARISGRQQGLMEYKAPVT